MTDLFEQLATLASIEALIVERVRESEVLEYKTADAQFNDRDKAEIAKDVSGMANALGGLIVYGVATDPHDKTLPLEIVPIDPRNIETLDRVINAQVRPPVVGLRKRLIPLDQPQVLVLDVPESQDPPHQSLYDKRYYRRSGVECLPMEHDLVALKFGRRLAPVLDLVVQPVTPPSSFEGDPAWTNSCQLRLFIQNLGRRVGRDVVVLLRLPDASVLQISDHRHTLRNIDRLYDGIQARQFSDNASVYHPGSNASISEVNLKFSRAEMNRVREGPLIEWTLIADEMAPRTGTVTLESLGWVLPE